MIKKVVKKFLNIIPLSNVIMFESVPDLSDNTMPVFEELIKRGFNEKYKMVWCVSDYRKEFPKFDNVIYVDRRTLLSRVLFQWYRLRSKCLISCNYILAKMISDQVAIYISHGTAIKSIRHYYTMPETIDYVLVASEGVKDVMSYELNVDKKKLVALGYPRNDVMKKKNMDLQSFFEINYKKIIVWYPTFRQHKKKKNGLTDCKNALPVLHNLENAIKLNNFAKENDVLLVIKPHFAQDVSYITDYNLSNITFINDNFFIDNNISSYEFVANCDALITDYSSIYFDYLLCDKPIAVVWEDIDEYRQNPGFAIDVEKMMKCTSKIYTLEDFKSFIKDISSKVDKYKELRKEINTWANYAIDGNNTQRVVDFIIEKARL